jgi:hypothetical protein
MNFKQQESRLEIFKRDKFKCHCGNAITRYGTPQLGHRIKQSKCNLSKYGKEIIHHPLNMTSCCSIACNARVDLGFKEELIRELVEKITKNVQKNLDI